MALQATLFCIEQRELGREPGPIFGTRFDTQYLPRGVWVAGFLAVGEDGEIQELLAPGYIATTPQGEASWEASVEYARLVLRGERESDKPYKGLVA